MKTSIFLSLVPSQKNNSATSEATPSHELRAYLYPHSTDMSMAPTLISVTIETEWNDSTTAKCHMQEQSLLFGLPKELRDNIFTLATSPDDDTSDRSGYGYTHACSKLGQSHGACVTLLSTCRRAWLEANHLAIGQAWHVFAPHEAPRCYSHGRDNKKDLGTEFQREYAMKPRTNA